MVQASSFLLLLAFSSVMVSAVPLDRRDPPQPTPGSQGGSGAFIGGDFLAGIFSSFLNLPRLSNTPADISGGTTSPDPSMVPDAPTTPEPPMTPGSVPATVPPRGDTSMKMFQ